MTSYLLVQTTLTYTLRQVGCYLRLPRNRQKAHSSLFRIINPSVTHTKRYCNCWLIYIYNGIRSLYFSPLPTCVLALVGEDGFPGPTGRLRRGTNADCYFTIAGWIALPNNPRAILTLLQLIVEGLACFV